MYENEDEVLVSVGGMWRLCWVSRRGVGGGVFERCGWWVIEGVMVGFGKANVIIQYRQ